MRSYGGFEGNAQTFRILSLLEKKVIAYEEDYIPFVFNGNQFWDLRGGLNLTYRSYASVIKYNRLIPKILDEKDEHGNTIKKKGIYFQDENFFRKIISKINLDKNQVSIEARIMDIADDIAYSTYDLEDAFKGGFIHPLKLSSFDEGFLNRVIESVNKALDKEGKLIRCTRQHIRETIKQFTESHIEFNNSPADILKMSETFASNAYQRNKFASNAISAFIMDVEIEYNINNPNRSKIEFKNEKTRMQIEILKKLTFLSQIESSRLKVFEHRGQKIVGDLFDLLIDRTKNIDGQFLISDIRVPYQILESKMKELEEKLGNEFNKISKKTLKKIDFTIYQLNEEKILFVKFDSINKMVKYLKKESIDKLTRTTFKNIYNFQSTLDFLEGQRFRLICDFVASMTNRYAIDYLDRLISIKSNKSIFSYF